MDLQGGSSTATSAAGQQLQHPAAASSSSSFDRSLSDEWVLHLPSEAEEGATARLLAAAAAPPDALLRELGSGPGGLMPEEATRRLARDGPNAISVRPAPPWWRVLLRALRHPFNLVLLGLAVANFFTGEPGCR